MLNHDVYRLYEAMRQQYDADNIDFDYIEKFTSSIIVDDDFDTLPEYLQDAVYFMDMHDLENIKKSEVLDQIKIIKKYLDESKVIKQQD